MLKRQNVSEKLNNVTMYASEEYWNTVGEGIQSAGSGVDIDLGLDLYSDTPWYWVPAKVIWGVIGYGLANAGNAMEEKKREQYEKYSVGGDQSKYK